MFKGGKKVYFNSFSSLVCLSKKSRGELKYNVVCLEFVVVYIYILAYLFEGHSSKKNLKRETIKKKEITNDRKKNKE